jgi:hypothetical protein
MVVMLVSLAVSGLSGKGQPLANNDHHADTNHRGLWGR